MEQEEKVDNLDMELVNKWWWVELDLMAVQWDQGQAVFILRWAMVKDILDITHLILIILEDRCNSSEVMVVVLVVIHTQMLDMDKVDLDQWESLDVVMVLVLKHHLIYNYQDTVELVVQVLLVEIWCKGMVDKDQVEECVVKAEVCKAEVEVFLDMEVLLYMEVILD